MGNLAVQVLVQFIKEGDLVVAHCPGLDVSAYGTTIEEAQQHFQEALEAFLEETAQHGTLQQVLREHGWSQAGTKPPRWNPPVVLAEKPDTIPIPV